METKIGGTWWFLVGNVVLITKLFKMECFSVHLGKVRLLVVAFGRRINLNRKATSLTSVTYSGTLLYMLKECEYTYASAGLWPHGQVYAGTENWSCVGNHIRYTNMHTWECRNLDTQAHVSTKVSCICKQMGAC